MTRKLTVFFCNLAFCIRCSGISSRTFEIIKSGELDIFNYTCRSCKRVFPSLDNIDKKLTKISDQQETRIRNLEHKIEKIEVNTKTAIASQLENFKDRLDTEIDTKIHKIVDEKTHEMDDRRRRELNVVLFNLDEGKKATNSVNKLRDEYVVQEIANGVSVENLEILTSYRLGKKPKKNPKY